MTAKEYKKMCRIRVTRLGKFITWATLVLFFVVAEWLSLSGYITALIGTTVWLYMPDITIYILEAVHKLNHDYISYR